MFKNLLFISFFTLSALFSFSQCEEGETEVTFILYTDAWGYENYWELTPADSACGSATILFDGNGDVGCDGTGGMEGEVMGNNLVLEYGPVCLFDGSFYDFHFVDSYGDGGLYVEEYEDGVLANAWAGSGYGNIWTFEVGNPSIPPYDEPCNAYELEVDGDHLFLNNEGASSAAGEVSPGGGSCAVYGIWCEGAVTNSVWAKFTATSEGPLEISSCHTGTSFDTQIAIWEADTCDSWSSYSLVSSNDDAIGGCEDATYASVCYVSCLEIGMEYYIQVDGWNAAVGDVELSVESYEGGLTFYAAWNGIACALDKGEEPNGFIMPYIAGLGADFESSWTGPNDFTSEDNWIFNLGVGTYSVEISDGCGGEILSESWTIEEPEPYSVNIDIENPACPESADGSIFLDVSGATPDYSVEWQGPDAFFSENFNITDLGEGTYEVTIEDAHGCEYVQAVPLVTANDFEFSLGNDTTICNTGTLILTGPVGGTYNWQDGSENQFFIVDGSELGEGEFPFILSASNNLGCNYTDAIVVTIDICDNLGEQFSRELNIYPNPNQGEFDIVGLGDFSNGNWELRDLQGKLITSGQLDGNEIIHVSIDLAPGVYNLMINDGDYTANSKLVVR